MVEQVGLLIYMYMFKLDIQSKLFTQDLTTLNGEDEHFQEVPTLYFARILENVSVPLKETLSQSRSKSVPNIPILKNIDW